MGQRANRFRRVPPGLTAGMGGAAALVVLMPNRADACIGSRLIFTFNRALVFLNLFIGGLEGLVAFGLFHRRPGRGIGIMIIANYFSLLAGSPLQRPVTQALETLIFSAPRILYLHSLVFLTIAVSFALSVIFEMPLCIWLFAGAKRRITKAVVFCIVSQVATYSFIGPWMHSHVATSVYEFETVPDTRARRNPDAVVYFLENGGGHLYRIRLDGTGREFVAHTDAPDGILSLFPLREENEKSWNLVGVRNLPWREAYLLEDIESHGLPTLDLFAEDYARAWRECGRTGHVMFDFAASSGNAGAHAAENTYVGGWHVTICRRDIKAHEHPGVDLQYQTPFEVYRWCVPSNLPEDEAVVAVDGQILLLDMRSDTLAFLTHGRSPFVVPAAGEALAAAVPAAAPAR